MNARYPARGPISNQMCANRRVMAVQGPRFTRDIPLEAIKSPMLLIVGADEDPDRDAAVTASRIAGSEIIWLAGLGHLGVFLDVEQSVARVLPFLERVGKSCMVASHNRHKQGLSLATRFACRNRRRCEEHSHASY